MTETNAITRLNAALSGRYRIDRQLGEGGMATVYLAEDLKHDRKVALKVLKPELAAVVGAERFLAEIKTTANLQHPHILPLFDSGAADSFLFYVMPYVEGESLRERLDRERQLPVDEAVQIARDVGEALDYAHRHGVIHRDIKPANILLQDGKPVVSDYGIALAVGAAGGGRLTETGLSLGSPHYMSPEQATGDMNVGAATDIYALGCVLYEMLVGEPPYTGSTPQAVLGKIVTGDADPVTKHRRAVPAHVDAAIRKALEKIPADRFAKASDFANALSDAGFRYDDETGVRAARGGGLWKSVSIAATGLAAGLALALGWAPSRPETAMPVARFTTPFEEGQGPGPVPFMDLSADGSALVYPGSTGSLWVRRWDDLDAAPLRGSEGGVFPVFSTDQREVAFSFASELRVVPLDGGPARTLTNDALFGAWAWGDDGFVYYTTRTLPSVIARVPSTGGGPDQGERVTELVEGEAAHLFFTLLPGGRFGVFQMARDLTGEGGDIWAIDLENREQRRLRAGHSPGYAPTGHLLFVTPDGFLMAQPMDPATAELSGVAVPVAEGVSVVSGISPYAISESGSLVYGADARGGALAGSLQPVWVSRSGDAEPIDPDWTLNINPLGYTGLRLSPDGGALAVQLIVDGNDDVWIQRLADGTRERLTFDGSVETSPFWSPDGDFVAYTRLDAGLWRSRADGTRQPEQMVPLLGDGRGVMQGRWSPDGSWIVFRTTTGIAISPGQDIMGFRPGVDSAAVPLVATPEFSEVSPDLSPNGRWLAYASNQTGRYEVYVRPFPNVDSTRITVSRAGGQQPRWAHSGEELFFLDAEGRLVAAEVGADEAFRVSSNRTLFQADPEFFFLNDWGVDTWDVAPDDQRFVMLRQGTASAGNAGRVVLVQNFFEELKRLVPVE
jgi:serine/threonine-protein kinase